MLPDPDPNRILVSGQSLAATAVGRPSTFTLSNVVGSASDLDIVIDSPSGEQVDAKVSISVFINGPCRRIISFIGDRPSWRNV